MPFQIQIPTGSPGFIASRAEWYNKVMPLHGTPFPAETLTASRAAQWYVDNVAVSGQTGSTYTVRVTDIGKSVRCGSGQAITIWHPRDVVIVKACWRAHSGVLNSVGPDIPINDGQSVRRWVDIINGYQADQATVGLQQPIFDSDAFGVGLPGLVFDGAHSFLQATDGIVGAIRNCAYAYVITSHRLVSAGSSNNYVAAFNRTGGSGVMLGVSARFGPAGAPVAAGRRTFAQSSAAIVQALAAVTTNTNVLTAEAEFTNGTLRAGSDGVRYASGSLGSSGQSEDQNCLSLDIGTFDAAAATNRFNGSIAAIIVAAGNTILSTRDRNRLAQYAGLCAGKNCGLDVT